MADIVVTKLPVKITAADANANRLDLSQVSQFFPYVGVIANIKVTTGSFQFSVGSAPSSDSPTYDTNSVIPPIAYDPAKTHLYVEATTQNDVCEISFT